MIDNDWLGKPIRKKLDPNNRKNSKNESEMTVCEQKPLAKKRIFVQTPFSHSTSKFELKNYTPQNHSLFRNIAQLSLHPHSYNMIKITATSFVCDQLKRKYLRAQAILERPKDEFWHYLEAWQLRELSAAILWLPWWYPLLWRHMTWCPQICSPELHSHLCHSWSDQKPLSPKGTDIIARK